jgi:Protein of unknown function (DUF3592)
LPDLTLIAYLPAAILDLFALVFWIVALILFIRARSFVARGMRVQGRVVGYSDYTSRGRRMYAPIYEATVADGRTLQVTSGIAMSTQSPAIGTVAPLLYRPHDPSRPLAMLGISRYIMTIVFTGVAATVTIPAIAITATAGSMSAASKANDPTQALAEAFSIAASASAMNVSSVTSGNVHAVGGELGTFDITLNDCQSGEHNSFYGADFYAPGSDNLRLRYVHDEAAGDIVKVAIPSKPGTVTVFDRAAKCTVLEGSIEKTNITTSRAKGNIKYINGHVKFDCAQFGTAKGRVSGQATFTNCH